MKKELREFVENYQEKSVHVVAVAGTEGSTVALFLKNLGFENVVLHDFSEPESFKKTFHKFHSGFSPPERVKLFQEISGFQQNLGENYLKDIEKADLIFLPQSWKLYEPNKKLFEITQKISLKTVSELYLKFAEKPTIGVTGSNGKTTTVRIIRHILESHGKQILTGSNDRGGKQMLTNILNPESYDFVLLELSHRQLQFLDSSPDVAGVTYFGEDHLDECGSLETYHGWKKNIFKFQSKNNQIWLNYDDEFAQKYSNEAKGYIKFFSTESDLGQNAWTRKDRAFVDMKNFDLSNFSLMGDFNRKNLILALGVCSSVIELDQNITQKAIDSFSPPENRLQLLREENGIKILNNIISRTPESTVQALKSVGKCVLICGGESKNLNLESLVTEIISLEIEVILLPGSGSEDLKKLINENLVGEFEELDLALNFAKSLGMDKILISPSFTGFTKFVEKSKLLKP